jgi:lysozyme
MARRCGRGDPALPFPCTKTWVGIVMGNLTTSPAMRKMIENWEGCVLHTYLDSVGVPTIGYGHTGADVTPGRQITQAEADALLASDLHRFEDAVNDLCADVPTTQQQFDALVSFSYNLGEGALAGSTLFRFHRDGDYAAAAAEFPKWDHAGGQVLAGLLRRRKGEAAVYLNGAYA